MAYTDPARFHAAVEPFLLAAEARYNLLLGLTLRAANADPRADVLGLVVQDTGGSPAAVGLIAGPRGLVLTAAPPAAVAALVAELAARGVRLPAVHGPTSVADAFVAAWAARTGAAVRKRIAQRLHRLDAVADLRALTRAPGRMRVATAADADLAERWIRAFARDAGLPDAPAGPGSSLAEGRLFLWGDVDAAGDAPRAQASWSRPTPNGCAIGAVYTPLEHRGRGYATALVACLSQRLLEQGRRFCTLFTDVANPTSNHVYARVGYVPIDEFSLTYLAP